MKLGVVLRNMGPASEPDVILPGARAAEDAGLDELWVVDHVAIPPDDAEGSNGRYLDPLTTLAVIAGTTARIGIGTAILNLPYRPPLPTAKAIATLQELSGGRLRLGVGVGWMKPEFRALGVDRTQRGRLTDEMLAFLHRCFAADEVEAHGQPFLFRPRPERPPIFVGGGPPHAFARAVKYGEGWMPMGGSPDSLAPRIAELHAQAKAAGRPEPEVVCMTGLPLDDTGAALAAVHAYAEVGVTRIAVGGRYTGLAQLQQTVEPLGKLRAQL